MIDFLAFFSHILKITQNPINLHQRKPYPIYFQIISSNITTDSINLIDKIEIIEIRL